METTIQVHPNTNNPNKVWNSIKNSQIVEKLEIKNPTEQKPKSSRIRIVCISDTHNKTDELVIPNGDVLIHAGDFTARGEIRDISIFNNWLGNLPHSTKIVIAGNHELSMGPPNANRTLFDNLSADRPNFLQRIVNRWTGTTSDEENRIERNKRLLSNAIYLEDNYTTIHGIKIYGSPWQPEFGNWAFNLERGKKCLDKWNLIPEDTDILITHGPALGYGDLCKGGKRAGCVELLETIKKRVKPKYHIFGHIHEDYGMTTDGTTTFINASTVNLSYKPINKPIVFDIHKK